jgi:DNA-binding NtrC family response regulator
MMQETVLIVDDEQDVLRMLQRSLKADLGCKILTAPSGRDALQAIQSEPVDVALVDVKMPGMDGLQLLERIRQDQPWLTVVMMTAHGCIDLAVEAIRGGAYDFITKPFEQDGLVLTLEKALERNRLLRENLRLQRHVRRGEAFRELVGDSPAMKRVYDAVQMVSGTDMTVLITGESGTGKDLVARAVHALSERKNEAFVAVNCPTVPENILESELFGYKKGAFTHATQNKPGLFQEAHRGTIFLDEIGDISTNIQTKLLRVLQEKTIKPLGDTKTVSVDVRVIASTNRNLQEKMKAGEFREDLFYRLNVLPIAMPPLRERRDDVPRLVSHFLDKHGDDLNRPGKSVSPELMEIFMAHDWEGNVRELENVVMRGMLLSPGDEILPEDLGWKNAGHRPELLQEESFQELPYREAKEEVLKRFNSAYLGRVLASTQGNVSRAAKLCGMERQALQQILRRYNISPEPYRKTREE